MLFPVPRPPAGGTQPGDIRQRGVGESLRVPAEQVLHVFHPLAEGQIRVPWVAPAMVRLWLLDQYDDAELDRKKVAAMFAGFVTRPGPDDVMGEDSTEKDSDGAALIGLQPGTVQLLLPGEDIKFSDPADVGGSYEAFQYRTLLACCAAKQAVDQQFARWVMLHVQSNPLPICTRPRVLIKGKRT